MHPVRQSPRAWFAQLCHHTGNVNSCQQDTGYQRDDGRNERDIPHAHRTSVGVMMCALPVPSAKGDRGQRDGQAKHQMPQEHPQVEGVLALLVGEPLRQGDAAQVNGIDSEERKQHQRHQQQRTHPRRHYTTGRNESGARVSHMQDRVGKSRKKSSAETRDMASTRRAAIPRSLGVSYRKIAVSEI